MIPPVYQPLPYALSGLSYTQLPISTQQYLQNAKLVPPHAPDVNFISAERLSISTALFSNLIMNDLNLVKSRLATIAMARNLAIGIPSEAKLQRHVAAQERRLQYVFGNVLPKRELILDAFMIQFDALVWLDQQGREHYTPEDWQSYRDALLKPILDNTSERLVALYKVVRTRPVLFGYHNHRLPYSPFGSSRATRGHTRSRGSATRGPADRGGRMLRRHS
ncbi:hypothetical protein CY34DRAFT_800103 [Suillus luteus UH-Slu-Lm8-n1]|uniref:Unplaced genomic scaffold CY34scaffold_24, whole genome shotgun sequence n=1 Tax=Suillus luteus UH-Slu-Lm8-n1 TaxID=930992 RepID=A0A0D0BLC1_9AGAM|nr:hypothetical protein CY34DRAFT_800103 [Suillus luteus UH-Slu-Lm8-n1]